MGPAGFEPATNQVKQITAHTIFDVLPTIPSRTVLAPFNAHGSPEALSRLPAPLSRVAGIAPIIWVLWVLRHHASLDV